MILQPKDGLGRLFPLAAGIAAQLPAISPIVWYSKSPETPGRARGRF